MRRKLPGLVIVFLFLSTASAVLGCACCSENGRYSIWTGKPDSYHIDVLKEIKLSPAADLYMDEAEFDGIKGLAVLRKEYNSGSWTADPGEFTLSSAFNGNVWRFVLKSRSGKTGTVVLPITPKMLIFKVDIHDNSDQGLGPSLYKEFRFQGKVTSGTGFFKPDIAPTTSYFLVFQGRGNECDNASDFTHWRLEITGPRANYAFFGATAAEAAEEKKSSQAVNH